MYIREVSYNGYDTVKLINKGCIAFNKNSTWDVVKKSRIIESLILNIDIGNIWVYEECGVYKVIDGSSRLNALKEFCEGDITLEGLCFISRLNGLDINGIGRPYSRKVYEREIRFKVVEPVEKNDIAVFAEYIGSDVNYVKSWLNEM